WRLARTTRKLQDRRASAELPDAKRLLGALTNSRGHRHEENAARLVNVALEQPLHVAVALLASAEAYTPTAQRLLDGARERRGPGGEVANALADNLPQAKQPSGKSRRRRRRKKRQGETAEDVARRNGDAGNGGRTGTVDGRAAHGAGSPAAGDGRAPEAAAADAGPSEGA
ncbi:MAG: hypothetical protein ICV74_09500, partial [Thermoleophilia bacterium]|nr:hypothetical protein [Thermoleophilia bacterium]